METLPVEMCEYIILFCDSKSIINLNQVSRLFYNLTKNEMIKMKCDLYLFAANKDAGILKYVIFNDWEKIKILLELNLLNINKSIFYTQEMCNWDGTEYVGYKLLLNICIRWKRVEIIKMLIKYGADVNKLNADGITPLMKCVSTFMVSDEIYSLIDVLCKAGADPNKPNNYGYIPMDMISHNYHITIIEDIQDTLRDYGSHEGSIQYMDDNDDWIDD